MKNKILPLVFLFFCINSVVYSQESDVDRFIADMLTLAGNFAQPAADGAAYQAGAGWFSSAESLEKWDFRVSVHGNALFIPDDEKNFSLQNSQLRLLEIEGAQSAEVPSAFGGFTDVYYTGEIGYTDPATGDPASETIRFKAFDGIDRDYVPHAFAQVAVGLPKGTEFTLRAMPEVTIDGVTASTFGAGLKHNFNQYFRNNYPGSFQIAAAIAYSKFFVEYDYKEITVENLVRMNNISVDADLWMLEAIGSKRWGVFELFGALGATRSQFDYEMGGGGIALGEVNSQLKNLGEAQTQLKADLGFNLHFSVFRISAMATGGDFFNANLGLHVKI